eukprot:225484-Pyramimonas_sp.AAC.1
MEPTNQPFILHAESCRGWGPLSARSTTLVRIQRRAEVGVWRVAVYVREGCVLWEDVPGRKSGRPRPPAVVPWWVLIARAAPAGQAFHPPDSRARDRTSARGRRIGPG